MEIDYDRLDKLLEELYRADNNYAVAIAETYNRFFKITDRTNREYASYMAELSGLGLAVRRNTDAGTIMRITPLGREVHKVGGWKAYDSQKKQAEQQERDYREKEVKAAVDSANSSKSSKKASWVSTALAFVAAVFSGLQYFDNLKKDETISKLNEKSATLDSLLKNQQKTMIDLTKIVHQQRSSKSAHKE